MKKARTVRPFAKDLPRLLVERSLSLRALALLVGVGDDHLSRVLRGDRGKRASGDLTSRVARALSLPDDYFPEARVDFIVARIKDDPALRDRIYDLIRREDSRKHDRA
jgi:transcriptional regulator with XRE-family HTH domain